MSVRKAGGAGVLLLAAVAIGVAVREYRFRAGWERPAAEASKAVQPVEGPKILYVQEPAVVEPEPVEPEPVSPPVEVVEASGVTEEAEKTEPAARPVEEEPEFDEAKAKEKRGREALALIGYDPAADEVWIEVINDPSVPANARKNLIEDLNEDGFADPHNTTWDDVPVIKYRIALIEDLRPYAMDKTNADAFDEAHKDLVNMANRFGRQ